MGPVLTRSQDRLGRERRSRRMTRRTRNRMERIGAVLSGWDKVYAYLVRNHPNTARADVLAAKRVLNARWNAEAQQRLLIGDGAVSPTGVLKTSSTREPKTRPGFPSQALTTIRLRSPTRGWRKLPAPRSLGWRIL